MSRHSPNKAEAGFFAAMLQDGPLVKRATDLEPDTAAILGVQSVSPSSLKALEGQSPPQAPQPSAEPETEEAEPSSPEELGSLEESAAGVDMDGFDRTDAEPPTSEETPVEPDLPSRLTHGKLFTDKRAHPLQVYDILCMRYQEDWVEWEPETLWWALRRDFGPVGEVARNKIMALRLAAVTDAPWLDWDTFENSSLAWNDTIPLIGAFQPIMPTQAAFGVQVLRTLRGDEEFSWEVKAYIAAILEENGFVYAPDEWFAGAQEVIDRKVWLVGFKTEVASAWEKVKDVDPSTVDWDDSNPLDVHLVKLAVVKRYLEGRDAIRQKVPGGGTSHIGVAPPVPA